MLSVKVHKRNNIVLQRINEEMCTALKKKFGGRGYKGVIYGQFMATRSMIRNPRV